MVSLTTCKNKRAGCGSCLERVVKYTRYLSILIRTHSGRHPCALSRFAFLQIATSNAPLKNIKIKLKMPLRDIEILVDDISH